jgi:hypothetical protein
VPNTCQRVSGIDGHRAAILQRPRDERTLSPWPDNSLFATARQKLPIRAAAWTSQFSRIARAAEALSADDVIIYLAFDLLYLDRYDFRGAPPIERASAPCKTSWQSLRRKSSFEIVKMQMRHDDDDSILGLGVETGEQRVGGSRAR